MPKKQNFERVGDIHKNIGVSLISPLGSKEKKSIFKKIKDAMEIHKIVWKTMANR
jgi:hypothetical protein